MFGDDPWSTLLVRALGRPHIGAEDTNKGNSLEELFLRGDVPTEEPSKHPLLKSIAAATGRPNPAQKGNYN